jgi:ABC-type phosphate/phosphonate transport system substrate-binding protein
MLASLPMYDFPEVRAATDAWWRGIAKALERAGVEGVPKLLTRNPDIDVWHSPELLLTQTCGYPLTHELAGVVELVATPAYAADGCKGADYCSLIVVSEDNPANGLEELRGSACAYSRRHSHSGYNAIRAAVAPLVDGGAFFSRVVESGGHPVSIELVATGQADVCAVDCVTHALMARYQPAALAGTRIMGRTEHAPGLPYVTRAGVDQDYMSRLRDGLQSAIADTGLADARDTLLLTDVRVFGYDDYQRIDDMEDSARVAGYAEIH